MPRDPNAIRTSNKTRRRRSKATKNERAARKGEACEKNKQAWWSLWPDGSNNDIPTPDQEKVMDRFFRKAHPSLQDHEQQQPESASAEQVGRDRLVPPLDSEVEAELRRLALECVSPIEERNRSKAVRRIEEVISFTGERFTDNEKDIIAPRLAYRYNRRDANEETVPTVGFTLPLAIAHLRKKWPHIDENQVAGLFYTKNRYGLVIPDQGVLAKMLTDGTLEASSERLGPNSVETLVYRLGVVPIEAGAGVGNKQSRSTNTNKESQGSARGDDGKAGEPEGFDEPALKSGKKEGTSKKRSVPKRTEMKGKAAELVELIEDQEQNDTGMTQDEMLKRLEIPKDSFRKSEHFKDARDAWKRLQGARQYPSASGVSDSGGTPRQKLICRSCDVRFSEYICPKCQKVADQCQGCHAEDCLGAVIPL